MLFVVQFRTLGGLKMKSFDVYLDGYCIKAVIDKREFFYQVSFDNYANLRAVECFKTAAEAEAFAMTKGKFEYRVDFMVGDAI